MKHEADDLFAPSPPRVSTQHVPVCMFKTCVRVCVCVCCGTLKKTWKKPVCGFKNVTVCTFITSPCKPAPRAHVETCVRVVPVHTGTFCFERKHGDVLSGHTGTATTTSTSTTHGDRDRERQSETEKTRQREKREREREKEWFGEHLLHPTLCVKSFGA